MAARPIVYRFVFGKGQVKRRKESEDTSRAVVEQASIAFAENHWEQAKRNLQQTIESDVRAELIHTAGEFRRYVIGAPGNQRGLVGTLNTVSKGEGSPKENLGNLPRWAPRTAKYLQRKGYRRPFGAGTDAWFDNTGWSRSGGHWPHNSGLLREFFKSQVVDTSSGSTMNIGSGGIFEDLFGGISVRIVRNNKGWGINQGTIKATGGGKDARIQLGTVYVRALGRVSQAMLQVSDTPNRALLNTIASRSAQASQVALHLRGGKGRYRPTLEPYLKFFLEQALPFAVQRRIAKGTTSGRLFR